MEILNLNTLIEAVIILLLYLYWKLVPNNGDLNLKVKELKKMCYQMSESLEVDRTEMWEHIEGTLKPLTQRLRTRIARAEKQEEQDLNTQLPKKKGGIMSRSELKKYGID